MFYYSSINLQIVTLNAGTAGRLTVEIVPVLVLPVGEETRVKVSSGDRCRLGATLYCIGGLAVTTILTNSRVVYFVTAKHTNNIMPF